MGSNNCHRFSQWRRNSTYIFWYIAELRYDHRSAQYVRRVLLIYNKQTFLEIGTKGFQIFPISCGTTSLLRAEFQSARSTVRT